MSRTVPPPEAVLIRRGREALGISPEVAAQRAKIKLSGRRWRQLEAGTEGARGPRAVMSAPQLAHMAFVVRVEPGELEELDQFEAAAILRTIQQRDEPKERPVDMIRELQARLDRIVADPERREMLDKFARSIDPGDKAAG